MERKIWGSLIKWKQSMDKKALMVTGARQIGKTYIIRQFAREQYENFVEINFVGRWKCSRHFFGSVKCQCDYYKPNGVYETDISTGKKHLSFLMRSRSVLPHVLQLNF